jgi:MATE family multidrug resistance protein
MNKKILKLAIPNIISNISVPLLSAVDTILMGHISTLHLSALGLGAMIFVFLYGNFGFLRMGTTGITAQAYGEDDRSKISYTLYRALLLGLFISLVLIISKDYLFDISSYLMNVDNSSLGLVKAYFDIRIFAAPSLFLQLALFGWFFGMQNAMIPLYVTIFINIINIALSYYFVNILNLGIEGAAYGTVIAQYSGVILGFVLLLKYKGTLVKLDLGEVLRFDELKRFLNINKDIFIRTVALTFVLAFFYSQSAKNSQDTLAVMVLLLQFLIWFSFAVDGFANATESLVGRYYGAKDWGMFDKAIRYNFYWGGGFALVFSLIYFFGGEFILNIYTSDLDLINRATPFIPLVALLPIISFFAFIYDGIFIGMTASKSMRDAVVVSMLLFLTLFYMVKTIDYEWALWGSFMMFFVFRGVIQWWMFKKNSHNLR